MVACRTLLLQLTAHGESKKVITQRQQRMSLEITVAAKGSLTDQIDLQILYGDFALLNTICKNTLFWYFSGKSTDSPTKFNFYHSPSTLGTPVQLLANANISSANHMAAAQFI